MNIFAEELIEALNLEVISEIKTNSRQERRRHLPEGILVGNFPERLKQLLGREDLTVWEHQAKALEHLANRRNVIVSTGTASGKSLVFQIDAIRRLSSDTTSRILVIYPLKALASDQFGRWKRLVRSMGLEEGIVGRLDGNVPTHEGESTLSNARILLVPPDVCHAWMMRNVGSGPERRFLDGLSLVVLDEAHIYESAFGSNVAFLLRRLIAAKKKVTKGDLKRKSF